ncbi:hypothetical protein P0W64_11480 [Tsukamurella sp. 8F]|uniref:Rv0361 family membrane protein n=1 Tax=unclassified Tsukamurella TaxID=2633480 RepID=UPI0023B91AE0|nr:MULTISPECIES: hypothetical protein [unclassified Tsukamurella]MDF0529019.1 hypothetical protein [Tsukamurella sp. 8J]MDF0587392.1 hypothetical protein [Tsukamurella sp. 8F]
MGFKFTGVIAAAVLAAGLAAPAAQAAPAPQPPHVAPSAKHAPAPGKKAVGKKAPMKKVAPKGAASPQQVKAMTATIQSQLDAVLAGDTARVKRLSCGLFADDILQQPKMLPAISKQTRLVDGRLVIGRPRAATVRSNQGKITVDLGTAKNNRRAAKTVAFTLDRTSGSWKVCAADSPYVTFAGLAASA